MLAFLVKAISVGLLWGTAYGLSMGILPEHSVGDSDSLRTIVLVLFLQGSLQFLLLVDKVHTNYITRMWSDTLLQVTGFTFICMSGIFVVTYPPFTWIMAVLPSMGILLLFYGRVLSIRSRERVKQENGNNSLIRQKYTGGY